MQIFACNNQEKKLDSCEFFLYATIEILEIIFIN